MASPKQTRNVTLVGGSGTVGAPILAGLLAAGHRVTVLSRPDSTATFPAGVTVHQIAYAAEAADEAALTALLRGQEVLVLALNYGAYGAQPGLIRAAAAAGVPWVVPCEFGSDATHAALNERVSLMRAKQPFRALIEELGVSAWIGVTCNPWFDFSVRIGAFGLDFQTKTAKVFGQGDVPANFTTLRRVGESLAALLALPDAELAAYRNAWAYFSSFRFTQRELLASAQRATGTTAADWTVVSEDPEEVIAAAQAEVAKGNGMAGIRILFALLFTAGYGGDYQEKVVDYKRLGLEPEDLDETLRGLVKELGAATA